jgi:hypothetical protein
VPRANNQADDGIPAFSLTTNLTTPSSLTIVDTRLLWQSVKADPTKHAAFAHSIIDHICYPRTAGAHHICWLRLQHTAEAKHSSLSLAGKQGGLFPSSQLACMCNFDILLVDTVAWSATEVLGFTLRCIASGHAP